MKVSTFAVSLALFIFGVNPTVKAQINGVASSASLAAESSNREQDGLNGPVRRLRVETAKLLVKDGKIVESPRMLREVATYDPKGGKVDSVAYPVEGSTLAGKEEYQYDDKGNIIEMVLRGEDGAILSKESYEYQFDEFGNWKKMTSAVVVYENGKIGYEPIEVTYRTITYYYGPAVATVADASAETRVSKLTRPTLSESPGKGGKSRTDKRTVAVAEQPKAVAEQPKAVVEQPKAVVEQPKAVVEQPKAPVEQPKSASSNERAVSNPEGPALSKTDKAEPVGGGSPVESPNTEIPRLAVVHVSEEVLRKAAIELPQPEYPAEVRNAGIKGKVEVQFIIDDKGAVTTVRSVSGNPMLVEAALTAARKARFSATALSSQPANAFGVITYDFALPQQELASNSTVASSSVPRQPAERSAPREEAPAEARVENKDRKVEETPSSPTGSSLRSGNALPANTSSVPANTVAPKPPSSLPSGTLFERGMANLAAAKYAEAAELFRQVVRLDPTDALAYAKLGTAYSALDQNKEAIAALKQAIRLKRAFVDPDAYYRLGAAYIALNEHAAAVEPLKQSLYGLRAQALDPRPRKPEPGSPAQWEIHYALGLAYYGSASFRDAAKEFENTVRIKQGFASAHYGLGLSYFEIGDKSSAEKQEEILRKLKSPLADKLTKMLLVPAVRRNRVF